MRDRKIQRNPLSRWMYHHACALVTSCRELLHQPLANLLTLIVIGIAIALPAGLYLLLTNFETISHQWQYTPNLTMYLQQNASPNSIAALQTQLKQNPLITDARYISPQQGLAEFNEQSDFAPVLSQLKANPLPPVIVVTPKSTQLAQLQILQNQLQSLPLVASVSVNIQWIQRLFYLMTLGQRIIFALGAVFSLGVIFIVGNTIRLTMQQHREEMTVLKLIGATSRFIRRPFLYRGMLLGLFGGIIGWMLILIALSWLAAPARELAASYNHALSFNGISTQVTLLIILASGLLGLIGAWFAASRMLKSTN